MDEKRIKELFQKTGETLQAILEYFRLKDKVLWTGSWSSGSITVPNTAKYSKFKICMGTLYLEGIKVNGSQIFGTISFRGSSGTTIYQNVFTAKVSGNTWTIVGHGQMGHNQAGNHGTYGNTSEVTEIVGIDPVIPTALQNIIGGGYCIIKTLGGGISALIQSSKEYYSCYKQRKESNKEYKEPVLPHLSERSLRNICDDIYSVLPKEFTCRGLSSSRTSSRKCKQYNNDSECYNECGDKFRDIIVWLWKRNTKCRWRRSYVGATGSHEKRRRRESYDIQICIKCDYIWRKACSDQTDIEVWGCAA